MPLHVTERLLADIRATSKDQMALIKGLMYGTDGADDSDIWRSLQEETDRGAAVVAGAFVEEELRRLVRSQFQEIKGVTDSLFKGIGPLASSRVQADVALTMGLIPSWIHSELGRIRKIRNEFAHQPRGTTAQGATERLTFDTQKIKDLMKDLGTPLEHHVKCDTLREKYVLMCRTLIGAIRMQPRLIQLQRGIATLDRISVDENGRITYNEPPMGAEGVWGDADDPAEHDSDPDTGN